MLICCMYIMWLKQFKVWRVPAVIGSIVVAGALTWCVLLHSILDLKITQMNMPHSLIQECCAKDGSTVDRNTITRWFKKFCLACKNLNDQAKSGRPKTIDSGAFLQVIEVNLASRTQKVESKVGILQSSVFYHLQDLSKSIKSCWIVSHY